MARVRATALSLTLTMAALLGPSPAASAAPEAHGVHGPRGVTLTAVARDLGTLGGDYSQATAVAGSVVVGVSATSDGGTHVFAYDVKAAQPHMLDLGPSDGGQVFVDDGVVVGTGGQPFAYDLRSPDPHRVDLVGPAGEVPNPAAVAGHLVVGDYEPAGTGRHRAFLYDVAAAAPHLVDLGTLGGRESSAIGVAGSFVVGSSWTASGASHTFAYDGSAASPQMVDLTPGRRAQFWPTATHGSVVVGDVVRRGLARPSLHFRVDLATSPPTTATQPMRTSHNTTVATDGALVLSFDEQTRASYLSSLWGDQDQVVRIGRGPDHVTAADLDEGLMVGGHAAISGRAVVYDARAAHSAPVELPNPPHSGLQPTTTPYGLLPFSEVWDLDGTTAVGRAAVHGQLHAVVWSIRRAPSATLELVARSTLVGEGRTADLTVRRSGPVSGPAAVRYATVLGPWFGPGIAGRRDLRVKHGVITFAPGQRVSPLRIHITRDRLREPRETFYVALSEPAGALLTLDSTAKLVIESG